MMNKNIKRRIRWIKAVSVAAFFAFKKSPREVFNSASMIFHALLPNPKRMVSRKMYFRRMRACYRCPLFHHSLKTCGSPLSSHPELGCHCAVEIKNRLKQARCWLRDNTDLKGIGWTSKLMRKKWSIQ